MKFYKLPPQKKNGKKMEKRKKKKTSNFISLINWFVIGTLIKFKCI